MTRWLPYSIVMTRWLPYSIAMTHWLPYSSNNCIRIVTNHPHNQEVVYIDELDTSILR